MNALITNLFTSLSDLRDREEGQTMVEYSLILAIIAIAALVVLGLVGADIRNAFDSVENALGGSQG